MIATDNAQRLVMAIYDAAVDDDAWARLPGALSRGLGANSAILWLADASGLTGVMHNHEEKYLRAYVDYYRFRDPWVLPALERSLFSQVFSSPELISDRDLRKTEFFSDFMLPTKTGPVLGGALQVGDRLCAIGVHRTPGDEEFSPEQKAQLQRLLPHLKHAVQLKSMVKIHQKDGSYALDIVFKQTAPLIVCNQRGIVLFANRAAEGLDAGERHLSLGTSSEPIRLSRREATRQLHTLIKDAASGGAGGGLRVTGAVALNMFITVSPIPRAIGGVSADRALIAVSTADLNLPSVDLLRGMFGFTLAEAQIARGLLENRSLGQIQSARKVTENTIRTQLAHILAKTGAANQRELVRLLSTIPTV